MPNEQGNVKGLGDFRPDDPEYWREKRAHYPGAKRSAYQPELRARIITALKQGPATSRVICERMGVECNSYWRSQIGHLLRNFERNQLVAPLNLIPSMGPRMAILWNLREGVCEDSEPQTPHASGPVHDNGMTSLPLARVRP